MGKNHGIKRQTPQPSLIRKITDKLVFGFSELRPFSYTDAEKDSEFFIKFLDRLKRLGSLDWNTVSTSARHSFGTEKIDSKFFTEAAKSKLPNGMNSLLVFRAQGDNHVFLGYCDGNVFQIIFIEYQFGDVYKHG